MNAARSLASIEASLRSMGNLFGASPMKVVSGSAGRTGGRVDGLVLAYRARLDPEFLAALKDRSHVAVKRGRAGFKWKLRAKDAPPEAPRAVSRLLGLRARWATDDEHVNGQGVWGVLSYTDRNGVWTIQQKGTFIMQVFERPPRGSDPLIDPLTGELLDDPGYAIEIKFYAGFLVDVGFDAALREGEAMAALCGEIFETRLRRIDLCADVQGWTIGEDDVSRLVKRPRAEWKKEYGDRDVGKEGMPEGPAIVALPVGRPPKMRVRVPRVTKTERDEAIGAQDFGRGALDKRAITGLSVGRGGNLMARIYDKRAELERDEPRRVVEEARWKDAGWDGETRVSRVEFQIRGPVLDELGIRDPWCIKDTEWGINLRTKRECAVGQRPAVDVDGVVATLGDRLDWLWITCLDWVRIITPDRTRTGAIKRPGLLDDDPRWALLKTVRFTPARVAHPIKRWRHRAGASSAMTFGCALSQHARDGKIGAEVPDAVMNGNRPVRDASVADLAVALVRWGVELRRMSGRRPQRLVDDDAIARRYLASRVRAIMHAAADNIVEDFVRDHEGALPAVEHLAVRQNAQFYAHLPRKEYANAHGSTRPPDGDGPRSSTLARSGWVDDSEARETDRAVA